MHRSPMQRSLWADNARAIGITLVVAGHVLRGLEKAGILAASPGLTLLDSVIYSFHVPLFFFLSGIFFNGSLARHGRAGTFRGKLDRLVLPYLIWSLLQGAAEVLLSGATNGRTSWAEVFSLLWAPRAQFWFLYALALVMLLGLMLYRDQRARQSLAVPLLGLALYLLRPFVTEQLQVAFLADNFVFFAMGVWTQGVLPQLSARPLQVTLLALATAVLLQVHFHGLLGLHYTDRGLETLAVAATCVLAIIGASMLLTRHAHPWLLAIGRASMPIFLMHILAASGLRVVLQRGFGISDPLLHVALGIAIGVAGPMLAAWLWGRLLAPVLPPWTARLGWRPARAEG
ncbi:acyltransferase family protein [Roseomonas sp. 18066]|uniref:acyltransferase family protein n=1 Tax=Roseomonas sp. 18066 TaxID=2681412 RepID=UPI00135AEC56|nr:acyltransferase family protein [Roseomonas sp. 18066]